MRIIESNILDFSQGATGTIASLFDVAMINGVGITEAVAIGTVMQVPEKQYRPKVAVLEVPAPEYDVEILKERQTIIDFTCQYSGTVEALFAVAQLNGVSITQSVTPGTLLKANETEPKTVAFFKGAVTDIVTDTGTSKGSLPGGIGYMQIGTSFKVS